MTTRGERAEWAMDGAIPSMLILSLVHIFFPRSGWGILADLILLVASGYYLMIQRTDEITATALGSLVVAMVVLLLDA